MSSCYACDWEVCLSKGDIFQQLVDEIRSSGVSLQPKMSELHPQLPEPVDSSPTARLTIRKKILAQIEAALLSDNISISEAAVGLRGRDPYNQALGRPENRAKKPKIAGGGKSS